MQNNDLLNALYPILRNDLQAFSERCFNELHPADSYADSWAIRAVCYKIEQCIAGKILRLIICVPPRSLKSHIASVCLPAYLLGRDPTTKIISASYGHDLADKFANETRTLMKTPFYRDLFPSTIISATKDTQSEYDTTEHGGRRATSVEGSFTGFGGDYLIFDDLMKSADASSDAARKRVIDWFETTALTRLNNPKEGRIIIVMQRLHVSDLPGHLIEKGGWEVLNIPAIAEEDREYQIGDNKSYLFKRGELMHPERLGHTELDNLRHSLGSAGFSAQYQQEPIPPGGGLIKWEWFKHNDFPPKFSELIMSVDVAASAHGNYSAFTLWGHRNHVWYLVAVYRLRCELPKVREHLLKLDQQHRPDIIIIDGVGIGLGLFQDLRHKGMKHVYEARGTGKVADAEAILPIIEGGGVQILTNCYGLLDFRKEVMEFPDGKYCDQVDAMVQLLKNRKNAIGRARQHKRVERKDVPCEDKTLKSSLKIIGCEATEPFRAI